MTEVAAAPPARSTEEELQKKLQIQVVDVSQGVQTNAVDRAEEFIDEQTRLPEERSESRFGRLKEQVKATAKSIWYGNLARDYIRQREIRHNREQIVESRNLYVLDGEDQASHDSAMEAVVNRFTSDYLHEGERNEELGGDEASEQLRTELRTLVSDYAQGRIGIDTLREEKTRLVDEWGRNRSDQQRGKGLLFADNIVEVAQNARSAFEHGVAIDRIDHALGVKSGEAKVGVRTEVHRDAADRILEKLQNSGLVINETAMSVVVGIALSTGKFVTRKAATATAATFSLGAGAGIIGGLRERLRIKQERQHHGRQMAEGGDMAPGGPKARREQLEATRYEAVSATTLCDSLRVSLGSLSDAPDSAALTDAIANLAHAETRIKLSDQLRADFITYSSKSEVEQQRLDLDRLIGELKVALSDSVNEAGDAVLEAAGISMDDLAEVLGGMSDWTGDILTADMSDKDRLFSRVRRDRALKMGIISFASAVGIGALIQEGRAALSDNVQGVFEERSSEHDRRTVLAGLLGRDNVVSGGSLGEQAAPQIINEHTSVKLPEGYQLAEGEGGSFNLLDSKGQLVADHVGFDENGSLDGASQAILATKGFSFDQITEEFETTRIESTEVNLTPDEYLWTHRDEFTAVQRELWYDNDTPGVFDRNELKLWWGGQNGLDGQGNYVFNVAQMTPGGSFNGSESANFQQAIQEGNLKIALSMTRDSQNFVYLIDLDASGNAVIDKDSYIARSLFENQNGSAQFNGRYAEVVQLTGSNPEGEATMRMLATHVGDGEPLAATDTVNEVITEQDERVITTLKAPLTEALPTEIAPVLPIYGRRGLERLTREARQLYGYGYYSPEDLRLMESERSPRLLTNPDAVLNPAEEIEWYRGELERRRGRDYLTEVDAAIENSPELRELSETTRAIVVMPVAAATESENIYNALSLYAQQDEDAVKQTTILLHVNWVDDQMSDPDVKSRIEKTQAEIDRARVDFPDLRIAVISTEWERAVIARKGGVIGDVARKMYDVAMMSVRKAEEEGHLADDDDVLIIRNDADAQGMSSHYLQNLIKAAEETPDADAFTGGIRWDTATHQEFPGFGVATNFREIMHAIAGRRGSKARVPTIGINSSIKASTFAAVGGIGSGEYVGAGSDDLEIGNRVYAARTPADDPPSTRSGYRAVLRRLGRRAERGASYSSSAEGVTSVKRPIRVVQGAQIDTAGDRLLNIYRADGEITSAWDDFDSGGHRDRGVRRAGTTMIDREDTRDIDSVARRIELNISSMASRWFRDPSYVRAGLSFMFPEADEEGEKLYGITWRNGECKFALTPAGKQWLKNRLERDTRGRIDPFGLRVRRNLYHETKAGSPKEPVTQAPRLVKAAA